MRRLISTIKADVVLQWRNKLYGIGIFVAVVVGVGLSQLAKPEFLVWIIPALMLLVVGGTTLLYVAAMIIFERDQGTLSAILVSPLRTWEYLLSKVITLTGLATLESAVMIGGAMMLMSWSGQVAIPAIPILLVGIFAIGLMYTLIGIILVSRYKTITEFLMPMAMIAVVLQIPALYFLGMVVHPTLLAIPTSAPTMLMQGAYSSLSPGIWIYAIVYTLGINAVFAFWAYRSFDKYVVCRVS